MNLRSIEARLRRHWRQHGALSTLRFFASRILRQWRGLVFDANLDAPPPCTTWSEGDQLQFIGPDTLDAELTPQLRDFLGGEEAVEYLEGVRKGNWLFVVRNGSEFLHCGYVLFNTRQTKIIGEMENPPLIAGCRTAPSARGRGLYRTALNAEMCYLRDRGYRRAVIETDPRNIPSRKGIEAAGFQLCREARVWILLNWLVIQKAVEPSGANWRLFFL